MDKEQLKMIRLIAFFQYLMGTCEGNSITDYIDGCKKWRKIMLKALIFDLDGVLTDTAELHYLAWKRLSDELGLAFDRTQNEALKGVGRLDSFEIILKNNGKNNAYTQPQKEEFAARKNEYYKELIKTLTKDDVLSGITELLTEARKMGLKTAVASVSRNIV